MVTVSCPHCSNHKSVIGFGYNRSGTARCRCLDCKRCFTLSPRSRVTSPEKRAAIERALAERIPQTGIARMLKVGRDTIRKVRQNGHGTWPQQGHKE